MTARLAARRICSGAPRALPHTKPVRASVFMSTESFEIKQIARVVI